MSQDSKGKYELPAQLDRILASAAHYFEAQGQTTTVAVLANARVEIQEGVEYDNWDGGQTGHGIVLHVPDALFHGTLADDSPLEQKLAEILRRLAKVEHEYIAYVRILLDLQGISADWRSESGTLLRPPTLTNASDADHARLWGEGSPRVFLSHRAEFKEGAKTLKDELARYGAASFVAHEDIEPTRAWLKEIERALKGMDVLVAILASGFASSWWTNQEVGVALGRGVPVIALRIDEDPQGFIGDVQAIRAGERPMAACARDIIAAFAGFPVLTRPLLSGLVHLWENATNYVDAIRVMDLLDAWPTVPPDFLDRIERAYEQNDQLHGSVGVWKKYPAFIARTKGTGPAGTGSKT